MQHRPGDQAGRGAREAATDRGADHDLRDRDQGRRRLGRRQTGWITDPAAAEYRSLAPNRALLENLANKTGGRVIELEELETFAASLPSQRAPITEVHRLPLWHQGPLFLIALACFVAEWFIRRRKGLP